MENQKNKTHYRKVHKSDHLGVADLEELQESGSNLIFTISHVKAEYGIRVAGVKGDHNIAYFKEGIKPFVLNATNSKVIKKFTNSSFIEDWKNVLVQLHIQTGIKFGNDVVEGVRISHRQPVKVKPEITPNCDRWEASKAKKKDEQWTIEMFRKHFSITQENFDLL